MAQGATRIRRNSMEIKAAVVNEKSGAFSIETVSLDAPF